MRKGLLILLAFTMVFGTVFMVGCGKEENEPAGETPELMDWAYIEDKGELIIGLDDTFAPMGFRDDAGELVGFDIDLANAVAEELGVNVTFKPIDWNAKEMELSSKRIDCIWNGMSATAERQESMSLTDKYLNNRIVIFTMDPNVKIESAADLAKYKIATQVDSASTEVMEAHENYESFKNNITELKDYDIAIMELKSKRADCMVVDEVLGEYKNKNMGGTLILCDYNFGDDFYAIGCRKGETELVDKINGAIKALIDNGKATEISNKWFGRDIVIQEGYDN
ncbi:MAG: amino acid ABC transporter substrate-binding protein [Anaerovoracaceae bacterium]|jgi:polar amino acid transport system substrate-binding protein